MNSQRGTKGFVRRWRNSYAKTTRAYNAWVNARNRCHNPDHPQYADYGGRGITMCVRWIDDYDAFFEDMGMPPPGMSLDRYDNDQGYDPFNCRWATPAEQQRNTRRTRDGCLKDFAARHGFHYSTIYHRKRAGTDLLREPHKGYRGG